MACEMVVSNMALHEGLGRLGPVEGLRDSHPRFPKMGVPLVIIHF